MPPNGRVAFGRRARCGVALAVVILLGGCGDPPASGSYVDKVWRVESSSAVQPGTLYVLLSEGTLVVTSKGSRPALGQWRETDGGLTMIEDGQPYRIETLERSPQRWHIRSHNPGEPVDITLVPAG